MFSMEDITRIIVIFSCFALLLQLIAVLAGRMDKKTLLESIREMNANIPTLDQMEAAYARASEPQKLLIGVLASAVDFLGKSLPEGTFTDDLAEELDTLLGKVTDGLPNISPDPITVITPPPEPKPDIEPVG